MRTTVVRLPDEKAWDLLSNPGSIDEFLVDPAYPEVEIDKAWRFITPALAGCDLWKWEESHPGAFLIDGGQPVGKDLGFGPGRIFFLNEVPAIEETMDRLALDTLRTAAERYALRSGPYTEEQFKSDTHLFEALKDFISASGDQALFVYNS